MVAVVACPVPILQFFDNSGAPARGGTVLTQVGGINYPTYADFAGSIPMQNPIPLNSRGEISTAAGASSQLFLIPNTVYVFTVFDKDGNFLNQANYVNGSLITATSIGQLIWPQTPAEIAGGIVPVFYYYPEGDIRRYGALTAAVDNSGAINAALTVSSLAGAAAYLPGGLWPIIAPLLAPAGSSMYGCGKASIIQVANGVDGLQLTASDAGIVPQPRFFRDFQILGMMSGTTNAAHGIYINATNIDHTLFSNIAIFNFQYGMYVQGLYYSTIESCFIQNCYQGIYFNNQSVNVFLINNTVQLVSGGTLITASGTSTGISAQGAPEIESLHISGGSIYGYQYNISFGLVFEVQIEAVDISFATVCPIIFTSVLGPFVIRDCWIELASSAAGTWNTTTNGNLTGIFITAITPNVNSKVNISGNYIKSDITISGSTGIYIGNSNNGLVCTDNHIIGFDLGISGGNGTNNIGTTSAGMAIKNNTVNTTTTGIIVASGCTDLDLGPNYFPGTGVQAFTSGAPSNMNYVQTNVPMKGTATFAASTSVAVNFVNPMPFSTYQVAISGNAAGFCWVVGKGTGGFIINCSVSNSNPVDWTITA